MTAAHEDEDGNEVDPDAPVEPVVAVDDHRASLTSSTRVTWVAALVLLVASLAVLGVDRAVAAPGAAEQRQEMMQVAEAFTLALTNYDYRDLATTRQQVLDLSVRGFEQEFDRLLGGSGVQQALSDNQAVATATIAVGPLVADFGDHEARTFTVVEQTASGAGAAPTQQRLRVEVLLVETPDGWIVTGAEVS